MPLKKADKNNSRLAFAEYRTVEDAIHDLDKHHGSVVDGVPINVKFQAKTNTNMKRPVVWDKTCLEVLGINKSVSESDMKKIFPQATKIHYIVGKQRAYVNYETEADCEVDHSNFLKNRPGKNMKAFFKW